MRGGQIALASFLAVTTLVLLMADAGLAGKAKRRKVLRRVKKGGTSGTPAIGKRMLEVDKVARWQNLIPSFPWIAPMWRAGGATQGKEGIKFCSAA